MPQNTLANTPADRLLSLILLNEKIKEGYLITKKLEDGNTIIQIIHRVDGKRSEEYVCNVSH